MLFYFLFIHSGKYTYFASEITVIIKLAAFQIKRNFFYHTFGTFLKTNRKIIERNKIDTRNTRIHDLSLLSWLGTDTSMTSGGV